MIAISKSIRYGLAKAKYDEQKEINGKHISCEAARQNVYGSCAAEIVEEMREIQMTYHPTLKNGFFDFVITLSEDDAKKVVSKDDSKKIVNDFVRLLMIQHIGLTEEDFHRLQWIAYEHSQTQENEHLKHWHILCNRVTINGKLINDFQIGRKSVATAQELSKKYGFTDAQEKSKQNIDEIRQAAFATLCEMECFSFNEFKLRMTLKGMKITEAFSKRGHLQGYYIRSPSGVDYKSSRIDKELTLARIQHTFYRLHTHKEGTDIHIAKSPQHPTIAIVKKGVSIVPKIASAVSGLSNNGGSISVSSPSLPKKKKRKRWDEMDDDEKRDVSNGFSR